MMKKLFLSMVVAMMAISANAQFYVGGGIGIGRTKIDVLGAKKVTNYKFVPEVGYNFNKDFAIGVAFGWQGSSNDDKRSSVNPYARYTFIHSKIVDVFLDCGFGLERQSGGNDADTELLTIGFKPGLAVKLNSNLCFVTHVGFIGNEHVEVNGVETNSFGLDLDGNNIVFGLYYSF